MLRMFKIALVVTLLAAAVPAFMATSYAGDDSFSDAYGHKHDNHGW